MHDPRRRVMLLAAGALISAGLVLGLLVLGFGARLDAPTIALAAAAATLVYALGQLYTMVWALSRPERAWRYALIATTASVLGGIAGWLLGYYAYEAIARHGLWAGGWMGLFRVARCGPGGTHGIDPVPEHLSPHSKGYAPWRLWSLNRPLED